MADLILIVIMVFSLGISTIAFIVTGEWIHGLTMVGALTACLWLLEDYFE